MECTAEKLTFSRGTCSCSSLQPKASWKPAIQMYQCIFHTRISSTILGLLMIGIIFSLQDELLYTWNRWRTVTNGLTDWKNFSLQTEFNTIYWNIKLSTQGLASLPGSPRVLGRVWEWGLLKNSFCQSWCCSRTLFIPAQLLPKLHQPYSTQNLHHLRQVMKLVNINYSTLV